MSEVFSEDQARAVEKYNKDGPFKEPVVRCDACNDLVLVSHLHKHGMCACSNTRVRNVRMLNDLEIEKVRQWVADGLVDEDWLNLWVPA